MAKNQGYAATGTTQDIDLMVFFIFAAEAKTILIPAFTHTGLKYDRHTNPKNEALLHSQIYGKTGFCYPR